MRVFSVVFRILGFEFSCSFWRVERGINGRVLGFLWLGLFVVLCGVMEEIGLGFVGVVVVGFFVFGVSGW